MKQADVDYVFDEERVKLDVQQFLRGIRYDLRYPGNYKSVQSGRNYVNNVKGANIAGFVKVADAMLAQGVV